MEVAAATGAAVVVAEASPVGAAVADLPAAAETFRAAGADGASLAVAAGVFQAAADGHFPVAVVGDVVSPEAVAETFRAAGAHVVFPAVADVVSPEARILQAAEASLAAAEASRAGNVFRAATAAVDLNGAIAGAALSGENVAIIIAAAGFTAAAITVAATMVALITAVTILVMATVTTVQPPVIPMAIMTNGATGIPIPIAAALLITTAATTVTKSQKAFGSRSASRWAWKLKRSAPIPVAGA